MGARCIISVWIGYHVAELAVIRLGQQNIVHTPCRLCAADEEEKEEENETRKMTMLSTRRCTCV